MNDTHSRPAEPTWALRPFAADDHAAALALWQRTPGVGLSDDDSADAVQAYLARNPGCSFVACTADGRLCGTVLAGHDGRRGLVYHLVAEPGSRRRGLGRALLQAALRALQAQGIRKCHLMVLADNADGLGFWQRVGAVERVDLRLMSIATRQGQGPGPRAPG